MKKRSLSTYILLFIVLSTTYAQAVVNASDEYIYASLKPLIKNYQRPFTFLHIWPQKSSVAFTIAEKHDCVSILCDANVTQCIDVSTAYHNIVLLNTDLSIKDIRSFGECEHIDLTLVSNIVEQFPLEWKKAVDLALTFGDYIIFQAPPYNAKTYRQFVAYMKKKELALIGTPSGEAAKTAGELYQYSGMKKQLARRRWNYKTLSANGQYSIDSSFVHKTLTKKKKQPKGYSITSWHPGINLFTFKQLRGIYPSHEAIRSLLYPLSTLKHNDLRIFNLIIQGNKLVPIDVNENERNADPKKLLPEIIAQFRTLKLLLVQEFECPCAETYAEEICSENIRQKEENAPTNT